MKTDTSDVDNAALTQLINAAYGLDVTSCTFLPKGEDAYAYVATTSTGPRCFVRAQPNARGSGLERAYRITHSIREQCGLPHILAPIPTLHEAFTIPYGDFTVAVFPYIDGRTAWEEPLSEAETADVASLLAGLHGCGRTLNLPDVPFEEFDNPFAVPVLRALQAADARDMHAGDLRRQVRDLLTTEREDLLSTLARMDGLRKRIQTLDLDWTLTHGDPNLDNLMRDPAGGLHLTDWGYVALGPPERDLFAFTGESFGPFLHHYAHASKCSKKPRLHLDVFAFYFYRWSLQEIADYTTRILFHAMGRVEDAHAWTELRDYLPIRHDAIAQELQNLHETLTRVLGPNA